MYLRLTSGSVRLVFHFISFSFILFHSLHFFSILFYSDSILFYSTLFSFILFFPFCLHLQLCFLLYPSLVILLYALISLMLMFLSFFFSPLTFPFFRLIFFNATISFALHSTPLDLSLLYFILYIFIHFQLYPISCYCNIMCISKVFLTRVLIGS